MVWGTWSGDLPKTLIHLNLDTVGGVSMAQKLKIKYLQISQFHHYVDSQKLLDEIRTSLVAKKAK